MSGTEPSLRAVGIVGCGTMGSGIAVACAENGYPVTVLVLDQAHRQAGLARIEATLDNGVAAGRLTAEERASAMGNIEVTPAHEALSGAALVIEAVPERIEVKREVFRRLAEDCGPDTVLATNTSSLSVIELGAATGRPDRVVGLHFFNPAPAIRLVELARTVATAPEVAEKARAFGESLGKTVVTCRDRSGFIANLLLFPYLNEAVKLVDNGIASQEGVDAAMRLGAGHPMGPLELIDRIGLDSCMQILEALHEEFAEPRFTPAPAFRQLVKAGFTGRKSGRGFYAYAAPNSSRVVENEDPGHGSALPPPDVKVGTLGVAGTGTVAAGVAEVGSQAGLDVVCWGRNEGSLHRGRASVDRSLERAVEKGKLGPDDRDAISDRIRFTSDLEDLGQADLVVEAVVEDVNVKLDLFGRLGAVCPQETILATATSSLPVIDLAAATGRAERVLGLHFFNPVPVMKLVEVVRTVATMDAVIAAGVDLVERMGKRWVLCPDRAGFIVNRLLFPYINDAVRMLQEGYATAEDIDAAMTLGCNHPIGPLALADLVGLDVTVEILRSLHREHREPSFAPVPLLEHMVLAGYLGRKSGRGFRAGTPAA